MREFFRRLSPIKCVKFWIEAGICPVKELWDKSRKISRGGRESGISPEKLLCWRYTKRREGRESRSVGRFPLKLLDLRLRLMRPLSLPSVLGGRKPRNPTPGSLTERTWEPS